MPVFVDISTTLLYFPSKTISSLTNPFEYETKSVKEWIHLVNDSDIDVVVMQISSFTINCALENFKVDSFLSSLPVRFPDSIWSQGNFHLILTH